VAEAAAAGAQLVALPEYFPMIGAKDAERLVAREHDDDIDAPVQRFLSETAKRHGIWLVGGTIPLFGKYDESKLRNTCVVYDPAGFRVARYDKIHLFGYRKGDEYYDEGTTIEAGDKSAFIKAICHRSN